MEEKHENFVAVVTKGGKVAATNVKMSGSEKEVNENMYDISSEKRVTCGSFTLYTKSCKTTVKKCTKQACCACKVAFLRIRPIVVFHRSPALLSRLSITRFNILFAQIINIIEGFAFSPG